MAEERKGFSFLLSYYDIYKKLKDPIAKDQFITAICEKQFYGKEPDFENMDFTAELAYTGQKHSVDKSRKGFEDVKKRKNIVIPSTTPSLDPSEGGSVDPSANPSEQEKEEEQEQEQEKEQEEVKEELKIKPILLCSISDESELNTLEDQISFAFWKLFKKHKADMGINSTVNLNKAKLKDWSNHVDKTMRLDKRTHDEFKEVWKYLNTNEWWKGKVQSMDKLRKKFEQLLENARKETNKKTDGFKQNTSRSATRTHMQRQDYD